MKKKIFKVVGYNDYRSDSKSFRTLHLVGESFYPNHEGSFCCTAYVDIEDGYEVGDEVTVMKFGKSYVVC